MRELEPVGRGEVRPADGPHQVARGERGDERAVFSHRETVGDGKARVIIRMGDDPEARVGFRAMSAARNTGPFRRPEQFRRNPVRSVSPMARRSARKAAPPRCGTLGKRPDEAGGRQRETLQAGYIWAQFLRLSARPWHHHDLRRNPRPCAKCPPAERSGFHRNCSSGLPAHSSSRVSRNARMFALPELSTALSNP